MSASFRRSTTRSSTHISKPISQKAPNNTFPISRAIPGQANLPPNNTHPSSRFPVARSTTGTTTSFTKNAVLERKGTRPWVGGLTLTSSGLREVDAILGGGQPLGTVMLIEEDRWTQDLALALTRCWCAEAVAQGQILSLVASRPSLNPSDLSALDLDHTPSSKGLQQYGMTPDDLTAFLRLLPKDLHLEKRKRANAKTPPTDSNTTPISEVRQPFSAVMEEDEGDEEDFDEGTEMDRDDANANPQEKMDRSDAHLTNAWQYKLSVQRERMGQTNLNSQKKRLEREDKVFCHSYDLSGRMQDQYTQQFSNNDLIQIADCSCTLCPKSSCRYSRPCAIALYQQCLTHIEAQLQHRPDQVIRMLIPNAPVQTLSLALPLLLTTIRTRSLPIVLLLTIRPWNLPPKLQPTLTSLRRTSDAVFHCEGFAATTAPPPTEFSDLAGILSIKKLALHSIGGGHFSDSTTKTRPPSNRYGMKRDRRKLHVRMLHLPPEDFSKGGSSGGGVRSGGGRNDGKKAGGNGGKGGVGRKTALEPGMSCGSHIGGGVKGGSSLDF